MPDKNQTATLSKIEQQMFDTKLDPGDELRYQSWVDENNLQSRGIDPMTYTGGDYDMRGYWQALQEKDPRAVQSLNPNDKMMHFPDVWKKPSHETFSDQSIYAMGPYKKYAGKWNGDIYEPSAQRYPRPGGVDDNWMASIMGMFGGQNAR